MIKNVTFGIGGYDKNKPNGNLVEEIDLPDPPRRPLDDAGALATLLVVTGVLTLQDGANAVRKNPDELVAEAEAWALAFKDVT